MYINNISKLSKKLQNKKKAKKKQKIIIIVRKGLLLLSELTKTNEQISLNIL